MLVRTFSHTFSTFFFWSEAKKTWILISMKFALLPKKKSKTLKSKILWSKKRCLAVPKTIFTFKSKRQTVKRKGKKKNFSIFNPQLVNIRLLTYVRTSTTNWLLLINDRAITWNLSLSHKKRNMLAVFFNAFKKSILKLLFNPFTFLLPINYVSLSHPLLCMLSSVRSDQYVQPLPLVLKQIT